MTSERVQRLISKERLSPPERAANTPAVRRGGSSSGGITLFDVTAVGASSMTGTAKKWNGSSWITDSDIGEKTIYPHPGHSIDNYETGYLYAQLFNDRWFAVEAFNKNVADVVDDVLGDDLFNVCT